MSGAKAVIGLLVGLSSLLIYLAPKPVMQSDEARMLSAEPMMLRAVSNTAHTLLGDILWLMSTEVDELAGRPVDTQEVAAAARAVTLMDPYFFPAVNYFATYLASMKGEVKQGAGLYEAARWFDPEDFRLIFNEMILRITYEEPLDNERIVALARQAIVLPESEQFLGAVNLAEMVEGLMLYAADNGQRRLQAKKDLQWLLEHTRSVQRKQQIRQRLERF